MGLEIKKHLRTNLLCGASVVASMCLGITTASVAQDDAVTDDEVEEVVVTGSRLNVNQNLTGAAPVLTVGSEEIDVRGTIRIEDLINVLPQAFSGQASEVSNGASGTSTLNLRGLGAIRTLVLIDGKRLPYGASGFAPPNLDLVPTQLIERVDILTGGASAVYGSDAVGGVANFILKRDFEGIEIDAQAGFAQNGNSVPFFEQVLAASNIEAPGSVTDGEQIFVSLTLGANTDDGRGNVTLFAQYENQNEIVGADRTISACTLGASSNPVTSFGGFGCVGSSNFRRFANFGQGAAIRAAGNVSDVFQQEDGTLTPFVGGPAETFNFGALNFFQRPQERITLYSRGHYEISDSLEVYADLAYVDNQSDAQIAPTATFGTSQWTINCDNPFIQGGQGPNGEGASLFDVFGCSLPDANGNLPTEVSGLFASHRNVEGGNRNSFLANRAFRIAGGFRGTINDRWDFDLYGQFSRTSDESIATEDFIIDNVQQAFLVTTDENGNAVCIDPSGGCVPFNIFQRGPNGESLVTQEALDFATGVGIVTGNTEQVVVGANIQSDLGEYDIKSPWSDAGVGFLVGFEWRDDSLDQRPDQISQIPGGGFTGVGGATLPVEGSISVWELYTEVQIPLVTDAPFAKEISLNGQFRYSDYSTDGNGTQNNFDTETYGLQLTWAPVEDINFRAQYQRAVRAPNVIELFTGQNTGLPNLNAAGTNANGVQLFDPCASSAPIASAAACANTGVTAAQFGNVPDVIAGQTQSITGGNPGLSPESSDTFTVGLVFTPQAVPGLSVTVDYFDITVDDFITAGIPAQVVLDNCLATGDATFCDLITRGAGGTLAAGGPGTGFQSTNLNIANLETSGIDFQVQYAFDLADVGAGDVGQIRIDYAATYLDTFDFTPFPGGDPVVCAGAFGNSCVAPVNPSYRHRALFSWDTPWDLTTTVTWRYFSGTDNQSATAPDIDSELPTVQYVDLAANYQWNERLNFRAGVLNVFNRQAPVSIGAGPPLGNNNTFPTTFDTGRFFFFGVNYAL
ncbi:TonB-dependent receptor domain-containing protein [Kordiimonas sp. SCSIO 12610]|uniref:TonB-dependent receptor domain-containing protein n=1 Tax=Kordiimonas sp. SCSIO 12610 TaxID=2829597 RepID=UPI002108E628|nr:TonB-dependent receptor [Kordiimonas sp. SCSIO 12610]UTW55127.1 TonB-dependent receptor [Kordiimonas sp. SCSIO 12610]